MKKRVILDTNILMSDIDLSTFEKVYIPFIVLEELDKHKESTDNTKAFKGRRGIRNIRKSNNVEFLESFSCSLPVWLDRNKNDNLILGFVKDKQVVDKDAIFLTGDLNLYQKAVSLGLFAEWFEVNYKNDISSYTGWKEIDFTQEELADFYINKECNKWDLIENEYIIIKHNDEIVDKYKWTENGFKAVTKKNLKSLMFGDLKPKDAFQDVAIDSLVSNQFTAITGKAGSGKSLLSLMYSMWAIQNGKYDSLVIMYNPTKVRGAVDQGFYSGSVLEKGLQQYIGHMLTSKFGDKSMVDTLIAQGKIQLIPMSDCRGMEISDNQILYITEAQNTSVDLMKICLSRVSKNAKVIIEGDPKGQLDSALYDGENNGLLRAINVFKGHSLFGFVQLQYVHRSAIADIVDKM